jgi:hypothetical protein
MRTVNWKRSNLFVSQAAVNQIVLMFNPNSSTGDTYYLDNEAIYAK